MVATRFEDAASQVAVDEEGLAASQHEFVRLVARRAVRVRVVLFAQVDREDVANHVHWLCEPQLHVQYGTFAKLMLKFEMKILSPNLEVDQTAQEKQDQSRDLADLHPGTVPRLPVPVRTVACRRAPAGRLARRGRRRSARWGLVCAR